MATRLLRIHGSLMWLLCVTTTVLCVERFGGESGLRYRDWSRVLAIKQSPNWRKIVHEQVVEEEDKEREHRVARDGLREWLTPTDKWHFVVGYSDVRAYSAARRLTQGARIHHLPTRTSLHFFLVFITAASANAIRHHRLFLVVEPLLPYLKIEDLTLGRLIREEEPQQDAEHALKALLAHNALTLPQVASLAEHWEVALARDPSLHTTTLRYTDTEGQIGIQEKRNSDSGIKCRVSVTAIVCFGIGKRVLRDAAHFMASHAVVQIVELHPRYEAFNKWAKYVTQSVSGKRLPIFNQGLRGEGEVIACADTGIDMDHCFFRDRYVAVPFNAVNLQARKVVQYVMSWGDKTDFGGGHGTHVAGSIAGDTEEGAHEFAGMAPAAKLAFFDLGSNASNLKAPIELGTGIFDYGYMAGARIFSNSWGVLRQGYSSNSHEVDSFSYL